MPRRLTTLSPVVARYGRANLQPLAREYNALTTAAASALAKAKRRGPNRASRMQEFIQFRNQQRQAQARLVRAARRS